MQLKSTMMHDFCKTCYSGGWRFDTRLERLTLYFCELLVAFPGEMLVKVKSLVLSVGVTPACIMYSYS